jgi:hypothetical protein
MIVPQIIVWSLGIYVAVGIVFALCFVTVGAGRMDPSVQQSTRSFRVMLVPGAMALWPLLAWRWLRGVQHPPIERNAHREAAQ